jgi:hypothetical protein
LRFASASQGVYVQRTLQRLVESGSRRAALLMAAATVVVAAAGVADSAAPGRVGALAPEGKLAFPLRNSGGFLVTDLQGRELRTVIAPRGRKVVGRPAFGPGGQRLWFLTGLRGAGVRGTRLHVVPTAGRGAGRSYALELKGVVVDVPDWTVTGLLVSADERRIAIGGDPGSGGCWKGAIVSAKGRPLRRLTARGKVQVNISPWSPSTSRLIYSLYRWQECGRVTPSAALYVTGPRGAAPDARLATQADGSFSRAAWSPDERQLAVHECDLRASTSTCPLVVIETAARKLRVLARDSYPGSVVWAAASSEVVAVRVADNEGLWAFKADGSARRKLAEAADVMAASRDGRRLIISGGPRVIDVASGDTWLFPSATRRQSGKGAIAYYLR